MLAGTLALPSLGLAQAVDNGHHPVWAPDGRIYFHVEQGQDVSIYSVDADGSDPRRVTTSPGTERSIAWSADGEVAVFMAADGDEPYDIHVLEPDGSGRPLVVRPGHDWDPAFSPDGRTLVWMATSSGADHDLSAMDLAGGAPRPLTSGVGMEAYADWDPDGGKLVYLARRDGHNDIYEMAPDGSGSRGLTDDPAEDNGPRVSPDGRRIAFFSDRDGNFEIYVMNRDGSAPRRVTSSPGADMYPTWSPDGAWLAFESDRSGTTQIYRIRPDGTDLRQLTGAQTTGLRQLTGPQALDPCASELARQFDFWIGEWTVTQEIATQDGGWETYQARSTVAPALDVCALVERWEGTVRFYWEGMTEPVSMEGLSVRAPGEDGSWRIHWMDSRNPTFGAPWVGGFESGEGTFVRNTGTGAQTRIRFFDVTETSVEWELAVSANAGSTWTPLWKMHFRRVR